MILGSLIVDGGLRLRLMLGNGVERYGVRGRGVTVVALAAGDELLGVAGGDGLAAG